MDENAKKALALDRAKAKRKTLKQATTRIINKINELLENDEVDNVQLEECRDNLQEKADQIFQLDLEIENLIPELNDLEIEVTSNQEYRERITCTKTKTKKHFREFNGTSNHNKRDSADLSFKSNSSVAAVDREKPKVQLPKLRIEPFDGNLERFQEFWAQFESSIHNNECLSKVDKYNYLKAFLKGPALNSIQGLLVSEKNYDLAVELLKERYGREEILVRAHINHLLNLKPVKSTFQLAQLRDLYDQIEIQIRGLQNLGVKLNSYGSLLFPLLIKLIPDSVALEFNKTYEKEDAWNISELLKFFKREIETRERTFLFRQMGENKTQNDSFSGTSNQKPVLRNLYTKNKFQKYSEKRQETVPSATALTVLEEKCLFCNNSDHNSESCLKGLSEKIKVLKQNGRCFICLRKNHIAKNCISKVRCSKCGRKHNILICEAENSACNAMSHSVNETAEAPQSLETIVNSINGNEGGTNLQTVRGKIGNKQSHRYIRILLDLGSQKSFLKRSISKQFNLPIIDSEVITVYAFGQVEPQTEKRNKVKFVLSNPFDSRIKINMEALESEVISGTSVKIPGGKIAEICREKGIKLSDTPCFGNREEEISLLIGADFYWKIVSGTICRISNSLVAVETKLGWATSGTESAHNSAVTLSILQNMVQVERESETDSISELIRNMWQLEALGIDNKTDENHKLEDNIVFRNFRDSVKFENNRYIVSLPWNENADGLRNNYDVAKKRFEALWRRFGRNPGFHDRYEDVINKHLHEGIAEESEYTGNRREYFMPHQAVIRENKDTTKLRVVYDASSHAEKCLSLNDCLESGPNLYPEILQLLIKFRQHRIGITADIQSAFLQISLEPKDRDAVKFLWRDRNSEELKVLRMTRVIFGAKSSPFLLGATIKVHIKKYASQYPKACYLLDNSLYVDDLITGTDAVDEAIEEAENVKKVLQEGNFNMRKWSTNENCIQKIWEKNEDCDQGSTSKVLGYIWNKEKDTFQIEISELIVEAKTHDKATKREVLKTIGRLYDPLGFLSPFAVRARILLQEIWKSGLQWDDTLPQEFLVLWEDWKKEVPEIRNVEVPRHYFNCDEKSYIINCQLHCFVDSSEKAYGAVVYLKYEHKTTVQSRLVCSKSRVAPLKKLSLPRLELMAALIGARLSKTVQNYLKEHIKITPYFWSDSNIVLHWVKGSAERWKPFVQNRVREIQEKSEPASWRYCPTKQNPADLITRGSTIEDLTKNQAWWFGPRWLTKPETFWPKLSTTCEQDEIQNEKKKETKRVLQVSCIEDERTNKLFPLEKFSTLNKVLRVTAWIKRYVNNIKNEEKQTGPLTADEVKESENYWIRSVQREFFLNELQALEDNKPLARVSRIHMFNPFLDENNILRVGGRLQYADLNFSEKHPILLPDNSYFSEIITTHNHEKIGHAGIAGTLAQIREKFWLLRGRQKVKSILRKCITCQRFKSKPMCQEVAPLPPDRVKKTFPFEITGIDFAGPLYTKNNDKAYIVLFTCAVTRALHLELISNLTTESFLLAFRKFLARRGLCRTVYTDNAQTFKRAAKDLRKLWNAIKDPEVLDYFGKQGISWKFIVERAAWWGGFWERLVRSVKSCLKKILGRASLCFQELEAILLETEAMINSRPLTYLYDDCREPDPLSPAHFLIGRRMLTLPPSKINQTSSTKESLTRRYIYRQRIIEGIWRQWKRAYLFELRSAHRAKRPECSSSIGEGSVVLIQEDKQPRLLWKMAIVRELHEGRDGKVRACTLRLPNGTSIRRAVQHLHLLELDFEKTTSRLSGPEGVAD